MLALVLAVILALILALNSGRGSYDAQINYRVKKFRSDFSHSLLCILCRPKTVVGRAKEKGELSARGVR